MVKAAAKAPATVVTAAIFDFIRGVLSNKAFGKQVRTDVFIAK